MKYGSKQHDYLNRLLVINPKMTVGQAAKRLQHLETFMEQKESKND